MRLNAYVLAEDPTWCETSVLSYYNLVSKIVVSYEHAAPGDLRTSKRTEECLSRLRSIDTDGKMHFGGFPSRNWQSQGFGWSENDTLRRQAALNEASEGADWVLQIAMDEVMPNPDALLAVLRSVHHTTISAIEWPMRVFFRRLRDGRLLEVCARDGTTAFDYPAPVVVRSKTRLVESRHAAGDILRLTVIGDHKSQPQKQAYRSGEFRIPVLCNPADAMLQFAPLGKPTSFRTKVALSSAHKVLRFWLYYYLRWKSSPVLWRWLHDLHPCSPSLWPALKPCELPMLAISGANIQRTV